jgi:hypothetical protein
MKIFAVGLLCGTLAVAAGAAEKPVTLGVECEDFQFLGDWNSGYHPAHFSGKGMLSNGDQGAKLPAVTAIQIPRAGQYALWVRALDFPNDRPATRCFKVSLAGQRTEKIFGRSHQPGYTWEPGGTFDLAAGPLLLGVHDIGQKYARADALLLTTDLDFKPTEALGAPKHPRVKPLALPVPGAADPFAAAPVKKEGGASLAALENENLRIEFLPATREGRPTVTPRVVFKQDGRWVDAGTEADAETYAVIACGDAKLKFSGFYPSWTGGRVRPFTVKAGGAELETRAGAGMAVWDAGEVLRFVPCAATRDGNTVRLDFHAQAAGKFSATWELRPGERTARVTLDFVPAQAGAYALGYHLFCRKPLAEVEEVLLPMMWHGKRFPSQPVTLMQTHTPTPVALMQLPGARVLGVSGAAEEIPFEWPDRQHPLFGLLLRSATGAVQPAIYGPIPGTERARAQPGTHLRFAFRVLAQGGDWYAGYRTAADEVFGWRDYRTNVGTSLTEAALNMIDLVMDENYGGWWKRGKGPFQIETLNGVTHSSPQTTLSLYRLTGNEELYRRRTLPTLEYALSRSNPHFSPEPAHTGTQYPAGSMNGPISIYGTTTYGGLWELTQRRTSAFGAIALPTNGVKISRGYSHSEEFEEWLARHLLTGDDAALTKARELADLYLKKNILAPPTAEISPEPFFNVTFVPDWEGLLRLWEVTGEQKYLDGAALGARRLMTSVWTQPTPPSGETTVHPGGEYTASSPKHIWWKGPDTFRLGFPRKSGDAPEHRAPAWIPSNVGLGFEQPCTYTRMDSGGALIYQSAWAPNFLRLAAATGDKEFETYARNATLGRWGNYPGYYVVGYTDLPLNPRYPYEGPDVSCIYYHHILPHLAWTIDWLVAEAALRSGGKISFPSQRQHGYVWFDSREYGAAPGKVFDVNDAWLWFDRGVAKLDNPAINYLLAHTADKLCVVLMNENSTPEKVGVEFLPAKLGLAANAEPKLTATVPVQFDKLHAALEVPARGLVVLTLTGINVNIAAHQLAPAPKPAPQPVLVVPGLTPDIEVRAAALQVRPGPWDAYLWCTAKPDRVKQVAFHYQLGGEGKKVVDEEYPFELSIPVADAAQPLRFRTEITGVNGQTMTTPEATLAAPE